MLYDELGADKPYDTVIIGTGVACTPYLARTFKAPVLPSHVLVSVNSIQELNTLLHYTQKHNGIDTYAVCGYDLSMPDIGVAWIKIRGIPDIYADFIKRHKVKNVILVGTTGVIEETLARKVHLEARSATKDI